MDQTHIHLLINHLPIFGSILGGFVLANGIYSKSDQTNIAAYYVLIISSIGAVIAYLTGEAAEETVEDLQGISKVFLDQHEDASVFALGALITLGVVALAALFLTIKKSPYSRTIAIGTLILSLVSFGIIARTGYLGGQIRHTELNSAPISQQLESHDDND